jgi:gamma-glutamylcyclotransferase (GGCT)/AIG2-like uncharacterized protein YtfP
MLAWLYFFYGVHHGSLIHSGDWLDRNHKK